MTKSAILLKNCILLIRRCENAGNEQCVNIWKHHTKQEQMIENSAVSHFLTSGKANNVETQALQTRKSMLMLVLVVSKNYSDSFQNGWNWSWKKSVPFQNVPLLTWFTMLPCVTMVTVTRIIVHVVSTCRVMLAWWWRTFVYLWKWIWILVLDVDRVQQPTLSEWIENDVQYILTHLLQLTKVDVITCKHSLGKWATIHQVTTMLATSKNVLLPGHNHLLTTDTDDLTLWLSPKHQRGRY